jgi:hypothetical protein
MSILLLATTADINYFTGFEATRIQTLLIVLSLLSLSVWALVLISLLIRMTAKAIIAYRSKSRHRR